MARTSLFAAALLATVCSVAPAADRASASSLYARLGGAVAIEAIARDTLDAVAKIDGPSAGDAAVTARSLAQFICARTGGGCASDVPGQDFIGLVEPLRAVLRAHSVPLAARNELLEVFAPARRDLARR